EAAEAATMKVRARAALRDAEKKHREVWEHAQAAADEELADLRREAHRIRLLLQSARERGPSEPARDAVEAALSLPSLATPPAPLLPEAEPQAAEPATTRRAAEPAVPRPGLPRRLLP